MSWKLIQWKFKKTNIDLIYLAQNMDFSHDVFKMTTNALVSGINHYPVKRRQLHKNVESNIEQVLAATPHKTPAVRQLASHHENYTS